MLLQLLHMRPLQVEQCNHEYIENLKYVQSVHAILLLDCAQTCMQSGGHPFFHTDAPAYLSKIFEKEIMKCLCLFHVHVAKAW